MAMSVLPIKRTPMHGSNLWAKIALPIPLEKLDKRLIRSPEHARAISHQQGMIVAGEVPRMKGEANFNLSAVVPLHIAKNMIPAALTGRPVIPNIVPLLKPVFVSD